MLFFHQDEECDPPSGRVSPVYDLVEPPKVYQIKSQTPTRKSSRGDTPATSSATATPKSSRKTATKKEETPLKVVLTPLKIGVSGTPSSSRRKSVKPAEVTPTRNSRRQSHAPKRYRDDSSSGDDFEQKSTNSCKKARTERETPNKSSKVDESTPTRATRVVRSARKSVKPTKEWDSSSDDEDEKPGRKKQSERPNAAVRSSSRAAKPRGPKGAPQQPSSTTKSSRAKKVKSDSEVESESASSSDAFEEEVISPKKGRKPKRTTGSSNPGQGSAAKKRTMTPRIPDRRIKLPDSVSPLQEAQLRLHVAAVPDNLPCRENEFAEIFSFTEAKIQDGIGGCMYISGVPGKKKILK